VWTKGFGYADLENKAPAKAQSMYRLASITKPMTAMAILKLADDGKLDLDAEVQKYVPYFPKKKYPVTVRLVLGHLGGISHYQNYDAEGHFKNPKSTKESLAVFQDWDLIGEPGTRYQYSSYGYNLLGAVIEGASGVSYGEYMRKNIWGPLGMETIVMDDPNAIIPNRVKGYRMNSGKIQNSEFVDISSRFAAGGTRATVLDVLKFGKGLMDGKVISTAKRELMYRSMTLKNGVPTFYSAGLQNFPQSGRFVLQHSGAQQETSTHFFMFPSRKLVMAVAINLEGADRAQFLAPLFELLTGEAWAVNPYFKGESENTPLFAVMEAIIHRGRSHHEKVGDGVSLDRAATIKAFAEFNKLAISTINEPSKRNEMMAEVRRTRSMLDGPYEKIGFYMAKALAAKHGQAHMKSYSNKGTIGFFDDYFKLDVPTEFRIDNAVAKRISRWNESWRKSNTKTSRDFRISPSSDPIELEKTMRASLVGDVYPNYAGQLVGLLQPLAQQGKFDKVLGLGKLATDFYPDIDWTNGQYGSYLVFVGQKEEGLKFLRRAAEINPRGMASSEGLISRAVEITGAGYGDLALRLLDASLEIYPDDARTYHVIGVVYAFKKDNAKAVENFKKALSIDPKFPSAAQAKSEIERLSRSQ